VAPTSAAASPAAICPSGSSTLTYSGGSLGTGAVAKWYTGSCGGSLVGTGNSVSVSPTATTVYYVRYEGDCNTTSCASTTVTMSVVPAISVHPASTATCAGSNATFGVTATGTGLSYQWQLSTDGGAGWVNISAAGSGPVYSGWTTAALGVSSTAVAHSGYKYRVVVSGACEPSVTSNVATLTVNALPAITVQPVNQSVCAGGSTAFDVTATGAGLSYSWGVSTNGGVTWSTLANGGVYSGVSTAHLAITGATAGMSGYQYRVTVSGTCSPSVTSNAVSLSVFTAPVLTSQPASSAICEGRAQPSG